MPSSSSGNNTFIYITRTNCIVRVEKDFEVFIALLNAHKVEYLLIGAYAVVLHSRARNTGDIDFWINPERKNAERVLAVLAEFGFKGLEITLETLCDASTVIQLGFEPVRIDLMTSAGGISFDEALAAGTWEKFGSQNVRVISLDHLIASKRSAARPQDLADIDQLIKFKMANEDP